MSSCSTCITGAVTNSDGLCTCTGGKYLSNAVCVESCDKGKWANTVSFICEDNSLLFNVIDEFSDNIFTTAGVFTLDPVFVAGETTDCGGERLLGGY